MSRKWENMAIPISETNERVVEDLPQLRQPDLRDGLEFCAIRLESNVDALDELTDTNRLQINTALAMLAYQQQKLNREDQKKSALESQKLRN
jgi:hypothetical protein